MHDHFILILKLIKLKLKNFKKFVDVSIPLNRSLTVFVGRNNSGKTTVLQAIGLVLDIPIPFTGRYLNKRSGNTGTCEIKLIIQLSSKEWVNAIQLVQHDVDITNVNVEQLAERVSTFQISIDRIISYVDGITSENRKTIKLQNEDVLQSLNVTEQSVFGLALARLPNQNLSIFSGILYIPIERKFSTSEAFIPSDNLIGRNDYQELIRNILYHLKRKRPEKYAELIEQITNVFEDIDAIDISHNEDNGQINFVLQQDGISADVGEMGSGIQSIILMLSQILSPNKRLALLDEPDVTLHPGLVKQLVDFLNEISKDTQIIICSHNETFVNVLDRSNILHVKGVDSLESTVVELTESSQELEILDDIGISLQNFDKAEAETSEVIILVEGPTDWHYLTKLFSITGMPQRHKSIRIKEFPLYGKYRKVDSDLLDGIKGSRTPFLLIRDRDESSLSEIAKYGETLGEDRVHFLSKREIENYAINYDAILKTILEKSESKSLEIKSLVNQLSKDDISVKVKELSNSLMNKVLLLRLINHMPFKLLTFPELGNFVENNLNKEIDEIVGYFSTNLVTKISELNPEKITHFLTEEKQKLETEWDNDNFLNICPGKDLLKLINKWTTEDFGINVTCDDLIDHLDHVDSDIVLLFEKIVKLGKSS